MTDRHAYFTTIKNFGRTGPKKKKKKKENFFIDELFSLTQLKHHCLNEAFPIIPDSLSLYSQPFLTYHDYGICHSILIVYIL